jgi:RHH-type proline utilization regulon transcriptional repressor/proline dehydrogenase/delta 1-pyrroline-5-carboxylate dehydrogenase
VNIFRYRPYPRVLLRVDEQTTPVAVAQVVLAAATCDVPLEISAFSVEGWGWLDDMGFALVEEDEPGLIARLANYRNERLRLLSAPSTALRQAANQALVQFIESPVLAHGRLELRHYLREQAISQTVHRYGNLMGTYAREGEKHATNTD